MPPPTLGLIAYETAAREGLVLDEGVIVEIVRPGTGDPVPEGEVGEVVVTTLNPDYPLIRFGTGDLSAVLPGPCPTGRTNTRIRGWLGRADQTAKVRGMFVHPGQVADIARRHAEVSKARLVVSGEMASDRMTLHVEVPGPPRRAGRTHRRHDSRRDEAARRGGAVRAGQSPQRRQGDRGRPQARSDAAPTGAAALRSSGMPRARTRRVAWRPPTRKETLE